MAHPTHVIDIVALTLAVALTAAASEQFERGSEGGKRKFDWEGCKSCGHERHGNASVT
jgi:hypothetical protein